MHIQAWCFSQKAKNDAKYHLNVAPCPKTGQTPSTHTWSANHNTFDTITPHIL